MIPIIALPPLTTLIKIASAFILLLVMGFYAPTVLKHIPPPVVLQSTLPERVASTETRLDLLEKRLDLIEAEKISERLATIQTRQEAVLALLIPVALFIFTHTLEVMQRLRGKSRTRSGDKAES